MTKAVDIFSVYFNIKASVESLIHIPIHRNQSSVFNVNCPNYYKAICSKIANDVDINHISVNDIAVFLYYCYIFKDEIDLKLMKTTNVLKIKEFFTKDQFVQDKRIVTGILEKHKDKKLSDLFKTNYDGRCIVYDLIRKGHITPIFFIFHTEKLLTQISKSPILDSEYKKFLFVCQEILILLKRGG